MFSVSSRRVMIALLLRNGGEITNKQINKLINKNMVEENPQLKKNQ
jgi:hypothetical protein